jgi:MSHA pilin protein MshA
MKQTQRGFTLIELVMVIVILGVLAAVAIPKFVDLKGDAQAASTQGVAGALSSGTSINYATAQARGNTGSGVVTVGSCDAAKGTLQGGTYPSGAGTYTAAVSGTFATGGAANSCILTFTPTSGSAVTATFTAISVP